MKLSKTQSELIENFKRNGAIYCGDNCRALLRTFKQLEARGLIFVVEQAARGNWYLLTEKGKEL